MTEPKQTGGKGKIQPRWEKGKSGNPKGRPKKNPAMKEMAEVLPDLPALFAKVLTEKKGDMTAIEAGLRRMVASWINSGNINAGRLILEYAYGQPQQRIQHSGKIETPAPPTIVFEISQDVADKAIKQAEADRAKKKTKKM